MKKSLSTLAVVILLTSAMLHSRSPVLGQDGGADPKTKKKVVVAPAKADEVLKCGDSADLKNAWDIKRVILYPTGKGGRVYLTSKKDGQLPESITLCFRQDQWKDLSLSPRDWDLKKLLDVQYVGSNPVIASDSFESSLSSVPELPTDVRLITVKITFHRKLEGGSPATGPFEWSYRFPSGGWSSTYSFQLPAPDSSEETKRMAYTSELKIINQSGIDWLMKVPRELHTKPGVESDVTSSFSGFNSLVDAIPNFGLVTSQSRKEGEVYLEDYSLTVSRDDSDEWEEKQYYPTISLKLENKFPAADFETEIKFSERGQLIGDPRTKLEKSKPIEIGLSKAAIQVSRKDSIKAVGLAKGELIYLDHSKLTFASSLKRPVTIKGSCESGCCSQPDPLTIPAASSKTPTVLLTQFQTAEPAKSYSFLQITENSTKAQVDAFVKKARANIKSALEFASAEGTDCSCFDAGTLHCSLKQIDQDLEWVGAQWNAAEINSSRGTRSTTTVFTKSSLVKEFAASVKKADHTPPKKCCQND